MGPNARTLLTGPASASFRLYRLPYRSPGAHRFVCCVGVNFATSKTSMQAKLARNGKILVRLLMGEGATVDDLEAKKPARGGLIGMVEGDNACMSATPKEAIELAEKNSQASAAFSLSGLDEARKRANALLLVLLGGGGALASVGLARLGEDRLVPVAALACSAYWFLLAGYVAWRAVTTADVRAAATEGLLNSYPKWVAWAEEERTEALARGELLEPDAVLALRESAVRNCELAADEYRRASAKAFKVVDFAYRAAALTPIVAGVFAAASYLVA